MKVEVRQVETRRGRRRSRSSSASSRARRCPPSSPARRARPTPRAASRSSPLLHPERPGRVLVGRPRQARRLDAERARVARGARGQGRPALRGRLDRLGAARRAGDGGGDRRGARRRARSSPPTASTASSQPDDDDDAPPAAIESLDPADARVRVADAAEVARVASRGRRTAPASSRTSPPTSPPPPTWPTAPRRSPPSTRPSASRSSTATQIADARDGRPRRRLPGQRRGAAPDRRSATRAAATGQELGPGRQGA